MSDKSVTGSNGTPGVAGSVSKPSGGAGATGGVAIATNTFNDATNRLRKKWLDGPPTI